MIVATLSQAEIEKSLAASVGADGVSTDPDLIAGYRRCLDTVPEGNPVAVVRPSDAKQIQTVIKLANQMKMNLVPAASGTPRFKGGTVPLGDGVIVDLSGMRKVVHVDRRNKMAIVEPGVTFGGLKEEAEAKGLKVLMPLLPRATKSVLASYLEREPITIPKYHWDMTDPLLCTELVFGNGNFFRTGAASGPGSIDDMLKAGLGMKNPMGPSSTDVARLIQGAQGTLGIVTWASVKMEVLPTIRRCFFAPDERLERLSDFTYRMMRTKYPDEFFIVSGKALACMLASEPSEIRELASRQAPYTAIYCIAGYDYLPEKRVAYLEKDVAEIAQHYGVKIAREIQGATGKEMSALIDKPCEDPYWKLRARGGVHEIFFLTTLDRAPSFIKMMEATLAENGLPAKDLGIYIQPIQHGRVCHVEFHLYYDPSDGKQSKKAAGVATKASQALADAGAFFSRPYGPWADIAYARCPDTVKALMKIKNMFDPNGVMNRGKLCFKEV